MTFTYEDVIEAARKVVAEKGAGYSYEYPMIEDTDEETGEPYARESEACLYANPTDGTPSCIVGHVIAALDAEAFEQLRRGEGERGTEIARNLMDREYLPVGFWDEKADAAMQAAQSQQDNGSTWETALEAAENVRMMHA